MLSLLNGQQVVALSMERKKEKTFLCLNHPSWNVSDYSFVKQENSHWFIILPFVLKRTKCCRSGLEDLALERAYNSQLYMLPLIGRPMHFIELGPDNKLVVSIR